MNGFNPVRYADAAMALGLCMTVLGLVLLGGALIGLFRSRPSGE